MAIIRVLEMDLDFIAAEEGEAIAGAARLREPREAHLVRLYRLLPETEKDAHLAGLIARTQNIRPTN